MPAKQTLLVTGGTGSFGKTVTKSLASKEKYERIIIFSRDEKKQDEMRHLFNSEKIHFEIGDVRDFQKLNSIMRQVDVVFHAAALKQVPSSEFNPYEVVKTNILGTQNVIESSINNNVKKLVVLSTDKAVMPVNAMGISKAMAEKLALSPRHQGNNTVICCTRYGNVLASRGSVIPLFIKQIISKNEVTITDGAMTRFVMSLQDSMSLVEHAIENGESGDLFVKKASAVDIYTLFLALKEILGSNCNAKIIGPRHGEKQHETLVSGEEMGRTVDEGDYFKIISNKKALNYDGYISSNEKNSKTWESYSSDLAYRLNQNETVDLLLSNPEVGESLRRLKNQ